ncbi:hypothetical protein OAO87_03295 [bacterium]|nr:hypothetical protein [bacterium]
MCRADDAISDCISRAQAAALGPFGGGIDGSTAWTGLAPQVSARGREERSPGRPV